MLPCNQRSLPNIFLLTRTRAISERESDDKCRRVVKSHETKKVVLDVTKKYVNIPSEKYIYVHIYVCICVYTYLCKMDEYRFYAGLS